MSAWPDVQEKIELEFLQLQRLVDEHKSLLQKVTDNPPEPIELSVLSSDLLVKLLAYMGFRHVFRHAYTFDLRWEKMRDLVLQSTDVLEEIRDSVKRILG